MAKHALNEIVINSDMSVTIRAKGISLRSGLRLMLDTVAPKLTYAVRNEVLMITTAQSIKGHMEVRLYDVRPLVTDPGDIRDLATAAANVLHVDVKKAAKGDVEPLRRDTASGDAEDGNLKKLPAKPGISYYKHFLIVRGPTPEQSVVQEMLRSMCANK